MYYGNKIPFFGSQGFTSGKHQWDVEVSEATIVAIGITNVSQIEGCTNDRSREATQTYYGFCELSDFCSKQSIRRGMFKVRVLVDCDQRTVSLFDVFGNKTFRSVVRYNLTGKLFPFFCFECDRSEPPFNLNILPARVKVTV